MAKTSSKPPSGMRDFLPSEIVRRRHVIGIVEEVYASYGFQPLETPAVENLTTLLGKYGEEGDQLLFRLLHRREKLQRALEAGTPTEAGLGDLGLRYDLTVPLARVVARHGGQLPRFFKRYQIQPVWRADRPGKGRFREFYQCDVDAIGSASPLVDVECCHATAEVLARLGFEGFAIELNHRALLRAVIAASGVPAAIEGEALVALDKLDKIGREKVLAELAERGVTAPAAARLLALTADVAAAEDPLGRLEAELGDASEAGQAAIAELRTLLRLAADGPAGPHLHFAPALARGLGYYTGAIFEITVPDLKGSLGGGGRYDGLIGMFSGKEVPAVGFSLGLERIAVVMEERGLYPELRTGPDALVCGFPEVAPEALLNVAQRLRRTGLRVELYPEPQKKLKKQLKYANEVGAAHVAIVGEDELARGVVKLKNLETGEQTELPLG